MKKLKLKVFFTIFLILSLFTFLLIMTSLMKNYVERKNSLMDILSNFSKPINIIDKRLEPAFLPSDKDIRKIYLDFTIYTIILDDDGYYQEIINHTNNDDFDEGHIIKIASSIINSKHEKIYIGNLFFSKYAYTFTNSNTLIIIDNTLLNKTLINQLIASIFMFILCEIVIFLITYLITKWIITPVKKSFEKQKIFVADASHELKTPLSVMIASCDAYFNDKDDKWVVNMKNESERMIKLVTALLDLAKTEKEQEIDMRNNNLSEIVESSILTFESLFYDNEIKLKYQIDENIYLICNEDLIIELMSILIDNSIKHCKEKGKVFINLSKKNKQIILEVKNTGLPIKKEDEEKIFERFYKLDTSRNRNSNSYGLGLAIAKNIVVKHNGIIIANSSGGFTTFKVIWNQK